MKLSKILLPPPFKARHYKRTFVSSPDDAASHPNRAVIEMALSAVRKTLDVDVSSVNQRITDDERWVDSWPGEHYKLLAGFVAELQPKSVVEIGTHTGISSLCMLQYLPPGSNLVTFDLIAWDKINHTGLKQEDFKNGRFSQHLVDLANPESFRRHISLFAGADFIFVDGPKDRIFEPAFARNLDTVTFAKPPWVIFDDILDLNMLKFWRELKKPKLDLTSFGHWMGTGLVQWTNTSPT